MRPDSTYAGKPVSHAWAIVLQGARDRGVSFRLNSGRRTRAEQEALVREKGVWSPANPTGAAAYSPSAPHIRAGRQDHALDIDTNIGHGENGLQRELARMGLQTRNPIAAEPWHLEAVSERALTAVADRLGATRAIDVLGPTARRWADELIALQADGRNRPRRAALRRRLIARRKAEWLLARGGPRGGRRAAARRYDVLKRVTA